MRWLKDFAYYLYVLVYYNIFFLFWEVFSMGIFIPTKLSSIRQNFGFHFWKYFERIFDSNFIIHSNISRDKELITLVLVPEDQEHKLPKNRNFRLQSHLFWPKNKPWKRLLRSLKIFFSDFSEILQPPHLVDFSEEQKLVH